MKINKERILRELWSYIYFQVLSFQTALSAGFNTLSILITMPLTINLVWAPSTPSHISRDSPPWVTR